MKSFIHWVNTETWFINLSIEQSDSCFFEGLYMQDGTINDETIKEFIGFTKAAMFKEITTIISNSCNLCKAKHPDK